MKHIPSHKCAHGETAVVNGTLMSRSLISVEGCTKTHDTQNMLMCFLERPWGCSLLLPRILCMKDNILSLVSAAGKTASAEKLVYFHLVDVLILAAGQQGSLVEAQTQGQRGTYGLSALCQNAASFVFTLVFMSTTSVLVFLVWCYYHYDVKLKIL